MAQSIVIEAANGVNENNLRDFIYKNIHFFLQNMYPDIGDDMQIDIHKTWDLDNDI